MKPPNVRLLLVLLLLVCGMIRGAEKPQPDVKAAMEKAVAAQKECSQRLKLSVEMTNSIGMKLKLIPAGEFMMGLRKSWQELVRLFDWDEDVAKGLTGEQPQHRVRITRPFYLGVYEVTQAEFEEVMGKNPSMFPKGGGGAEEVSGKDTSSYPVEMVSWEDAVEFCKRLSAKEGKTYRLPTEAEWEYACRAGTTTRFGFGDDPASLGEYAWYRDNSDWKTHSVGEKKPNAWGVHDVHGNVWEWCADWYDGDYYIDAPTDDPSGPVTGSGRVFRGGCWRSVAGHCRAAGRYGCVPQGRIDYLGFRVAAVPPGGQPSTSPSTSE